MKGKISKLIRAATYDTPQGANARLELAGRAARGCGTSTAPTGAKAARRSAARARKGSTHLALTAKLLGR